MRNYELVVVKLLTFNGQLKWEIPRYLDYFDVETDFGKCFALVQSYINALSLEEHIKIGRTFSKAELKQISKSVLKVRSYLHNRYPPIIHRDVKPSNILLTNRSGNHVGDIYLVDFVSIQAAASEGGARTIVVTYGYIPPEQFGQRAVPASDLYGLSTTIIHLASGQHPADLPQENLRICFENHVSLSPSFLDWLQWMSEPALEKRLESAARALQVLQQETQRQQKLPLPVRPPGSKVILNKKRNFIEIIISAKGFTLGLIPTIIFTTIWNGLLVMWYTIALSSWSSGGWFVAFFSLGYLGVGLWMILGILFSLFGQIWLRIDYEQTSLKYQLFGFKYYRPSPAPRKQIIKLGKKSTFDVKDADGDKKKFGPQINIWARTKKFNLSVYLVSDIELDWLAHELSEWLNLPINQEKYLGENL